jgi:hypothetical protein
MNGGEHEELDRGESTSFQNGTNPLSFPSLAAVEPSAPSTSTPIAAPPRALVKDRLYVGNLHPSVDE